MYLRQNFLPVQQIVCRSAKKHQFTNGRFVFFDHVVILQGYGSFLYTDQEIFALAARRHPNRIANEKTRTAFRF
jgi:hypothetical protein